MFSCVRDAQFDSKITRAFVVLFLFFTDIGQSWTCSLCTTPIDAHLCNLYYNSHTVLQLIVIIHCALFLTQVCVKKQTIIKIVKA